MTRHNAFVPGPKKASESKRTSILNLLTSASETIVRYIITSQIRVYHTASAGDDKNVYWINQTFLLAN